MIKISIFLIFTSFISHSLGLLDRCRGLFQPEVIEYNLSKDVKQDNPYTAEVFSFVYQKLPTLAESGLSNREITNYVSQFEGLIDLMNSSSPDMNSRLELMNSHLSSALKAFPEILSFIQSGKASSYPSLDTNTILKLVLSTLGQHTRTYLAHHHANELDWSRLSLILKSIADFKTKPNAFSLYKIKRAVEQKYSVREYISCK